jgi:hypothetical protein
VRSTTTPFPLTTSPLDLSLDRLVAPISGRPIAVASFLLSPLAPQLHSGLALLALPSPT